MQAKPSQETARHFGGQGWIAVNHGHAERAIDAGAEEDLHIPLGMLNDLVAATSTTEILDCMSKWSSHLLDARHCVVALINDDESVLVNSFFGAKISGTNVIVPVEGSFLGSPLRNNKTNILHDVAKSEHPMRAQFLAGGIKTLIVTPIITQGRCFGTFGVGLGPEYADPDRVCPFLETLALCIANQLLIVEQITQLDRLTRIDPLTDTYNRRHFAQCASDMWQGWETSGKTFAMVTLDLDHFKSINDSFGHEAGDTVLQVVSRRIKRAIRPEDSLVRMGGEEFCLLIGDATRAMTHRIGRRIWQTIRQDPITTQADSIAVTASVGFALVSAADTSYHSVLKRADAGLYQAKTTGRDRVVEGLLADA